MLPVIEDFLLTPVKQASKQFFYTNRKPFIPVPHSAILEETYDSMKLILRVIRYTNHEWNICGDLKVVASFAEGLHKVHVYTSISMRTMFNVIKTII